MKNWKKPKNVSTPTTKSGKAYRFMSYAAVSGFGVGYFPFASGTAGSFATLPFAFLFAYFWGFWGIVISSILVFIIGVITSKEVLKYTEHDPSIIIIDEVVGQLLAFVFVAKLLQNNLDAWWAYVLGFFLFRFFDIIKPEPAKWADTKLLNAWGVMLDDVFAGLYAGLFLYLINIYIKVI